MADRSEPEGWDVRFRLPATLAVATPVMLLVILVASGWYYTTRLRPATHAPVTPFPAPGVEAAIHGGAEDPLSPAPHPHDDPAIVRAAREVARDGLSGWPAAR